jgi:hypothetical protein
VARRCCIVQPMCWPLKPPCTVFQERPHLFWTMARALVLDIHEQQGGSIHDALRTGTFLRAQPNAAHTALVELVRGWEGLGGRECGRRREGRERHMCL